MAAQDIRDGLYATLMYSCSTKRHCTLQAVYVHKLVVVDHWKLGENLSVDHGKCIKGGDVGCGKCTQKTGNVGYGICTKSGKVVCWQLKKGYIVYKNW